MAGGEQKLIKYLREAQAQELALISTLTAHNTIAEGEYRDLLQRHIRETRSHAEQVARRLNEIGFQKSPLQTVMGIAQVVVAQGVVMAKGPWDMLRGGSLEEKRLHNARDEAMTEVMEIATYDGIERLAESLGDQQTAELAARIRRDEENMLASLRELIPQVMTAIVKSEIEQNETAPSQVTERAASELRERTSGGGARRTARAAGQRASQAGRRASETGRRAADEVGERTSAGTESGREGARGAKQAASRAGQGNGGDKTINLDQPWEGYDEQTVSDITSRLSGAPDDAKRQVHEYERQHKNRKTVIEATSEATTNA